MANHTVALNARQEAVLAWLVAQVNAERQSSLTVDQFLNLKLAELLSPYDLRFTEFEAEQVKTAFKAADATTKAAVKVELDLR